MPLSALEAVDVDHVASARDLAGVLADLVAGQSLARHECPEGIALEVEIAAGARLGAQRLTRIADPSALSCPECHGVLSEIRGQQPLRYRCQTGHAHTARVLEGQSEEVEEAMRVALRVMEERVTLVTRMAQDARATGRPAVAELYEARAEEYTRYAQVLRTAAVDSLRAARARPQQE